MKGRKMPKRIKQSQIDKIGKLLHNRYWKSFLNENLQLSMNQPLADVLVGPDDKSALEGNELTLKGVCFNIKIGKGAWFEYKYIPISLYEYRWVQVRTK
jgi:hypothetical protein